MRKRRTGKKNRKKQSAGFVFPTPLAAILVMATILSLTFLWLHGQCEAAGVRIQNLEKQYVSVHSQVLNEQTKWSNMKSLPSIMRELHFNGVAMRWPDEAQIVRVFASELQDKESEYTQLASNYRARMNE